MKGVVVCPRTISMAISKNTNTMGTIHQALLCQANPRNSFSNRPRYFKNLISSLLDYSLQTRGQPLNGAKLIMPVPMLFNFICLRINLFAKK